MNRENRFLTASSVIWRAFVPKAIENKLKAEYPDNPNAVYGTLNKIGAMHGNKETAKGRSMEAKYERDHGSTVKVAAHARKPPAPKKMRTDSHPGMRYR